MKKTNFFLAIFAGIMLTSCKSTYTETVTYKINEPVFMGRNDFQNTARVSQSAQPIENHGKICFFNGFIYMAETGKGIHIIDNTDPANPQIVGFIELLGNADMSIRDRVLYADSFTDLVWFDLSNSAVPEPLGRLANAFYEVLPPLENEYGYDYGQVYNNRQSNDSVIVGWTLVERTEDVEHYYRGGWWNGAYDDAALAGAENSGGAKTGINGSMSRFSLYDNYLYSVINNQMSIIDLRGEPCIAVSNFYIGYNVETLFNYEDKMFMGTPTGMLIYSVENPLEPKYCSAVQHVFGCDPVVVENDRAYVTVHSGNNCGQDFNELIIINVADVYRPQQIVSYTMTRPMGLGIDNGTLFVCDDGLKIFNTENPQTIMANELAHYSGMSGYDVIAFNNLLMMIAEDGIYQYDYSDLNNIVPLSVINW
ncbi:MAG: hypothetical protein LBS50_09070 [Prevotellaceae bacterium]|jgi:hypothetical protein|nr:hypothetical protein [Prevotellaceae bacterium]